jgi:hypothetical protein
MSVISLEVVRYINRECKKKCFGVILLGVSEAHPGCHGYPGCCVRCEVGTEAKETGEYLSQTSCLQSV